MLRRNYNSINTNRFTIFILYRYLGFTVRTKVIQCSILTHFRQASCNTVRHSDRQRHQLRCLVRSKTKHQSLISSPNVFRFFIYFSRITAFQGSINPLSDVRRLFIQRSQYSASIIVETVFRTCIANFLNRITYNGWNIHVFRFGADFTNDENETSSYRYFTCYPCIRVISQKGIQYSIGYLITDFIRMAFCYRLGREQMTAFYRHEFQPPTIKIHEDLLKNPDMAMALFRYLQANKWREISCYLINKK
ncbi:hypothetical protein D1872_203260 [compost metagenome]